MIFSGAYSAASETAEEYISSVLSILQKKEKVGKKWAIDDQLSEMCAVAAITALRDMVFRRFCLNQSKYDSYEEAFRTSFFKSKGCVPSSLFTPSLETIATFLNWPKDKNSAACNAACDFFFTLFNDRSDTLTAEEVTQAVVAVAPHMSYISKRTREDATHAMKLLKAFFLYCSCDELHEHQMTLLKNGVFLYHLHRALRTTTTADRKASEEVVMLTVAGSNEGMRSMMRIFPTPLVNTLDGGKTVVRLSGMSYKQPMPDKDISLLENMAVCSLFASLRANWAGFWSGLDRERAAYDFIWNKGMKQDVVTSLQHELDDVRMREGKTADDALWDYEGYRMNYPDLQQFMCVDGYYIQQMLDAYANGEAVKILHPLEFTHHLCDLLIVTRDIEEKRALMYLISRVNEKDDEAARNFPVLRYLCFLLEDESLDEILQGIILGVLRRLCHWQRNTEQIQDYHALESLSLLLSRYLNAMQTAGEQESVEYETQGSGLKCRFTVPSPRERVDLLLGIFENACSSMTRIRGDLISEPMLSRLLRVLLLCPTPEASRTVMHIVSVSLASSPRSQPFVFQSGLFPILLLLGTKEGMSAEVAQLLYDYHVVQDPADVQNLLEGNTEKVDLVGALKAAGSNKEEVVELARKYSYLRFFLPVPMIVLLTREGPEHFREVFNADATESSDVLWGKEVRDHLAECVGQQLYAYLARVSADYHEDWKYTAPEGIMYESIENKLVVYNVFLEAFLKPESVVPYTVDPVQFVNELIHALEQRLRVVTGARRSDVSMPYRDILMILQSILKVLQTKKEVSKVEKANFAVLCRCLKVDLLVKSNRMMADAALDVILEAMKPASFDKPTTVNIYECAMAEGISAFDWVLQKASEDDLFPLLSDRKDPSVSSAVGKSLQCICLMASKSTPQALETLSAYPQFIHTLTNYIDVEAMKTHPQVGLAVMKAFELFLQDERLLEICVSSGCLIYFLEISLCLVISSETDRDIVNSTVNCLKMLSGFGTANSATKPVLNAIRQLITPGLLKSLKNDSFIDDIRSQNIRNPILIWNSDMANVLLQTLSEEEEKLYTCKEQGETFWNVQGFCHKDSYLHIYTNLLAEYIVDDVFLEPFLQQPDFDLQDPTPDDFLKKLMSSIVQLESSSELNFGDAQSKARLLSRLLAYLQSLQQLLTYHSNLQTVFVNDSNIHKLFVLLNDVTIGHNLQDVMLLLLETAVNTPSGCDILASFAPSLRTLLRSDCEKCYMPVLNILKQFVENNDLVVQLLMSSSAILILLDMAFSYEKSYDGNVQDMAVHLIGRMMRNKQFGPSVRQYMVALFTPLFRGKNEKADVLENCDDYPSEFLQVVGSEIHDPNVYWDAAVRSDLLKFLTSESHTLYGEDAEYQYAAEEVSKRMKPFRVTLNKQLVVADIFVLQYINNPFCEINAPAFLAGLMDELSSRVGGVLKKEGKEAEEYSALVMALKLFLQSNTEHQAPEMYTKVVSFCLQVLMKDVRLAQDTVLSVLEFIIRTDYGIAEFLRNNGTEKEASYVAELLMISDLFEYRNESSYRVTEVLHEVIRNQELRAVAYHAGALFYALDAILSNLSEIDSRHNTARTYMDIVKDMVLGVPGAEDVLLAMTTASFKNQFQKEPSILNLFIRKSHEAFASDNSVRVWNSDSRDALRETVEQVVKRLNGECMKMERWDRTSDRFTLDEVEAMWKRFTKANMHEDRKFSQESTAIKLRQTTIGPRPTHVPSAPERPRTGSM